VKGATTLSFPDITIATPGAGIRTRTARVLIYCNNNFSGAEKPFPGEDAISASLNLSDFVDRWSDYGY
jgi:hypothetical protein